MAKYSERAGVADNFIFIRRVRQAVSEAAVAIMNEEDTVENHANRVALAAQAIQNPDVLAQRMALAVANNTNVGTGSSDPSQDTTDGDNALQYVVSGLWDSFAGS
jgi:hypothetical protein